MSVTEWEPAFPGQRRSFEPGHELSTTHGAYSPRKIDPLARAYVDLMLADDTVAYLREPSYRVALWRWAQAESRIELLVEYLADMTVPETAQASKGGAASLSDQLRQWQVTALTMRRQLGLDPVSRAKLLHELTDARATARHAGLDEVREAGAALLAARSKPEPTDIEETSEH